MINPIQFNYTFFTTIRLPKVLQHSPLGDLVYYWVNYNIFFNFIYRICKFNWTNKKCSYDQTKFFSHWWKKIYFMTVVQRKWAIFWVSYGFKFISRYFQPIAPLYLCWPTIRNHSKNFILQPFSIASWGITPLLKSLHYIGLRRDF